MRAYSVAVVTRWCSYIVGEHGDSSVPIWSNVSIAGSRLKSIFPPAAEDPYDYEKWSQVHHDVVNAAKEIIKLKGYTSWSIGIMSAKLADAILRNQVCSRHNHHNCRYIQRTSLSYGLNDWIIKSFSPCRTDNVVCLITVIVKYIIIIIIIVYYARSST